MKYSAKVSEQLLNSYFFISNNVLISFQGKQSSFSNMNAYSFHSYGKSGSSLAEDIRYLQNSINNSSLPVIITEHNSHTSSDWNTINSTPDDDFEASRLASQIINLIQSNVKSHYIFKFSITPSFSSTRDVAMNGLHWGEISQEPFDLADTTLSAEAVRLLTTKLIKSKLYSIGIDGDVSVYRNYVLSRSPNDPFYSYIYALNDRNEIVNLNINLNQLNINSGAKILIEQVGNGYWNEISNIISLNSNKILSNVVLNSYTTLRIAVPNLDLAVQNQYTTNALYSCTLRAGSNSNINECSTTNVNQVGTSNSYQHENTCVGLIKFNLMSYNGQRKSILKLNIENVVSSVPLFSDMTLMVLGLRNIPSNLNQYSTTWNTMSSVLNKLNSGSLINSVSKNFINWSSINDVQIVGHINVRSSDLSINRRERMIDVSDYVDKMKSLGLKDLTFLIYRPYRHPEYKTGYGSLKPDDLSNGALVKFYSALASNANLQPQLVQFGI